MSKIKTGEMRRRNFGDVCNPFGSILGNDGELLNSGIVRVTAEQATAAEAFDWERVGEEDGMVLVSRSANKADLYVPFRGRKSTALPPHQTENKQAAKLLSRIIIAYNRADRSETTSQEFEDYALGLIVAYARGSEVPSVVTREPRQLLAQAYLDNGDYGSAATIRSGHDLAPDTQIALLAIKDALALAATPTPPTPTPQKTCSDCGGYGEYFGHSRDCTEDNCALAGGVDDCDGQIFTCLFCEAPTPPTLSEDLREVVERFVKLERRVLADMASAHSQRGPGASSEMRSDDRDDMAEAKAAFEAARAALAQVKAS